MAIPAQTERGKCNNCSFQWAIIHRTFQRTICNERRVGRQADRPAGMQQKKKTEPLWGTQSSLFHLQAPYLAESSQAESVAVFRNSPVPCALVLLRHTLAGGGVRRGDIRSMVRHAFVCLCPMLLLLVLCSCCWCSCCCWCSIFWNGVRWGGGVMITSRNEHGAAGVHSTASLSKNPWS